MSESDNLLQDRYFGHEHLTIIQPATGWRMLDPKELWAYRELLWVMTMRDVKVRYKQTVLGAAWAVIQPVMTMIVFSIIFGRLAGLPSDGYPYPIFVYSALLPWTFFANAVSQSASSVVGAQSLVSKVYFPRLLIPMSSIGAGLVDFAISAVILLALMLFYGIPPGLNLLLAPMLIMAVVFTALGVGTLLSALTVAYRDFRYVVGFTIQIWLYCTPVVYASSLIPERWQWVFFLNPMAGLIDGFRSAFLGQDLNVGALMLSFIVSIAIFLAGIAYFEKVERRFADII